MRMLVISALATVGLLITAPHAGTAPPEPAPTPESTASVAAEAVGTTTPDTTAPALTTTTTTPVSYEGELGGEPIPPTTVAEPEWQGSVPEVYGSNSGCTPARATTIARAMWAEGANDDSVEWMLRVASRESLCDSTAYNGNRNTGDNSYGLCQLNVLAGFFNEGKILGGWDYTAFATDFQYNAQACARLWAVCGRAPWTKGDYGCRTPQELR